MCPRRVLRGFGSDPGPGVGLASHDSTDSEMCYPFGLAYKPRRASVGMQLFYLSYFQLHYPDVYGAVCLSYSRYNYRRWGVYVSIMVWHYGCGVASEGVDQLKGAGSRRFSVNREQNTEVPRVCRTDTHNPSSGV